jgi:2-polyprenyl-6-methoxyphenol hydroxylase-like FAD-dependent oxidoreductase
VLRHADGLEETVRSAWLVGCDGAHSTVRRGLGIPFEGSALESQFVLADLAIEGSLIERAPIAAEVLQMTAS